MPHNMRAVRSIRLTTPPQRSFLKAVRGTGACVSRPSSGRGILICATAFTLLMGSVQEGSGQLTPTPLDVLGSHYGSLRRPMRASSTWGGLRFLLLTQFDQAWTTPTSGVFKQYDQLDTSIGYNYATFGHQWYFDLKKAGQWSMTLAASGHIGIADDSIATAPIQTALHKFLGWPHVYRPKTWDHHWGIAGDFEALLWPNERFAFGAHASLGTYHNEIALQAHAVDLPWGWSRWSLSATAGVIPARRWIAPVEVSSRLNRGYASVRGTFEHPGIGGVSFVGSSGIFQGEYEILMSAFLDIEVNARHRVRVEFVNDVINCTKDRGPTGGGSVTWTLAR